MTNFYANLEGTKVLGVFESPSDEGLPEGCVLLFGWGGWPEPPSPFHELHFVDGALTWKDPRSFEEQRDAAWDRIKAAREAAFDAPMTTPYGIFDSYAQARTDISDAVLLAQTLNGLGEPVSIAFTLADNSVVNLDCAAMVTVGLMLGQKVQAARAIATNLRTQIYAETTTTVAQLEAITWPA